MIPRQNYLDVQAYLHYLRDVVHAKPIWLQRKRNYLYGVLNWAGSTPLHRAVEIRPTLGQYLDADRHLTAQTQDLYCKGARAFFRWARRELDRYRQVPSWWIKTLRPRQKGQGRLSPAKLEGMISRANYADIQAYLRYNRDVLQVTEGTIRTRRVYLYRVLPWCNRTPLPEAREIRPTLGQYLAALDEDGEQLSPCTQRNICKNVRSFYRWAKTELPHYRDVPLWWIQTLKPVQREEPTPGKRDVWTVEDLRAIAALELPTLALQRAQAAMAFMFLSGIRIGAFVTLPIEAVDVDGREVRQWPGLGVKTKFAKAATTYLLDIPELLAVVRRWDRLVRARLAPDDCWYAHIDPQLGELVSGAEHTVTRTSRLRKEIHELADLAGVRYRRPHDLRHGHALYALDLAKDIADFKAISQNLMHSRLEVTDRVYAVLNDDDRARRIAGLGHAAPHAGPYAGEDKADLATVAAQLRVLLSQIEAVAAD